MKREDSTKLNVPLIEEDALSDDPFYGFLEELKARVDASWSRFDNWKRLLNETNTAENLAFKEENSKLKHDVSQLLTNVQELEEVVYRIEMNREEFAHISDNELASRQVAVKQLKQRVNTMKNSMSSHRTANKIKADATAAQAKLSQGTNQDHYAIRDTSNEDFIRSQQQRQQVLREQQDEHLEDLHESATRLNVMAGTIGDEIEDQGRMLDELADDLDQTESRMEHALTRMDKLLKSNNRCQTWTILMLILIATIMFFVVVNF